MFGLGVPELVIILVIALIIFGPRKLPEIGGAIGKSLREFKKSTQELKSEVEQTTGMDEIKAVKQEVESAVKLDVTLDDEPAAQAQAKTGTD